MRERMIKLSSSGHSQNHVTAPHRLSNNLRSSFVQCDLIQKRERNRKLCALSFTKTFRVYLALMTLDDMSRDRQTQSQAVRCSRFIPGRLSEGLKNVGKKICRDTAPCIAYCYLRVCSAAREPNTHNPTR